MLTRVKAPKDLLAGSIFLVTGAAFFAGALSYPLGTATSMGPGYFPAVLGILLGLLGLGAIVKGVLARTPDPLPRHKVVPLLFMVASVASFGLLIERTGFVVASFACLALSCYQRWRTKPAEVLAIFVCVTLFNYIVFIYLLGLPMPVFRWDWI